MSTKTTFKRVALVAVAALGLGVLASAPSSAAPIATTTVAYDTTTSTAIVGGQVTVQVTTDTSTDSTRATVASSGVGSVVSATSAAGADSSTVSGTPTSGTFYIDNTQPRYAKTNVVVTSAVVGSQVLTITPLTSTGTPGTAVTKTITWVAADTIGVSAAKSTSVINAYATGGGAAFTSDAAITAAAGSVLASTTGVQKAAIKVTLLDSNGVAVNGKAITATVSGPGLLQIVDANETQTGTLARALTSAALSDNVGYVTVANDGSAGVATVTISVGSTVIATETITFSGAAAKYEVTSVSGVMAIAANGSTDSATTGIAVKVTDSAGNLVDGEAVFLKSGDTTIATVSSSSNTSGASKAGYSYFVLTGVKSGSAVISACNTAACTSATITGTATVKVAKTEAATVTAAFDKTSYAPGEKMTLNIVAKDADGNAVADANAGTYTMSANLGTTSTLPTAAEFVGGTHAVTIYAPVSSGTFTVSIKLLLGAAWATALDDTTITASADVVNPGQDAATDAANEATDAANAATDAALAAADAADAATAAAEDASAAVAALAKSVNTALNNLKKQITALTKLVNKLLK
jgi:protocatechuate 3,4-dioxygenase beta subunit